MSFLEEKHVSTNQKGMSLVEVLVSLLLVMFVLFALLGFTKASFKGSRRNMDKQFAVQKAISMLEELKTTVPLQTSSASTLDAYDDGTSYNPVLTTDKSVTNAAAAGSDNLSLGAGGWKYLRQVSVSLLPGTTDANVRLVAVRLFINKDENLDGRPDTLAEVAGVIRTAAGNFPPTQVYDIYAIAIDNVPGWWVYMANLIPFMQNTIQNVESRNPGLEFRVHWITKLAYGRDTQYRPQINSSVDSRQPINNVYFYPGKMPAGEAVPYYYPPDNFKGHILIDSTDTNGYNAATNPDPYAIADNYNHAMRYPDELALFNQRVADHVETDDAPTLRILLERLYAQPDLYRNAIFVNLHGEMFPFPPVRNYSDAAKDPGNFPNIRAVTHPERLRSTSVKLRVYSYRTDPDNTIAPSSRDWLGQNVPGGVPITVTLKGVTWTPASGSGDIVAIRGGTDQDGTAGADAYVSAAATTTVSANGMYYTSSIAGGDTIINLYNSPLKTPEVVLSGSGSSTVYKGLHTTQRLYGQEYTPAPSEDFTTGTPTPFASNLSVATHGRTTGATVECTTGGASPDCTTNTARWIITVPSSALPGGSGGNTMLTVETRINSTTTGTRTNTPPNLSRTYAWRGSDAWVFGAGSSVNPPHLPITEMYQIQGDPRHNPYADLKMPHQGSGLTSQDRLGMGYNRYFDDFSKTGVDSTGAPWWKGYSYTVSGQSYGIKDDATVDNDGWKAAGSYVDIDMQRIYQTLRMLHSGARVVYTTMTGYSYYYCGLGGEIGYDSANNFPNSIPVDAKLFTGSSGATYEQSIIPGTTTGLKYIRENSGAAPYWWGMNWLGELYPDAMYAGGSGWAATGNLPTGTGANHFVRVLRSGITSNVPRGTDFIDSGRRTGPEGSTSYYWNGATNATFHHIPSDGTGDLQAGGTEIASRYNFPLSNDIPINRPFNIAVNDTGDNPDHYLEPAYDPVYTAAYMPLFYNHSVQSTPSEGSAMLSLKDANNNVEFVVVNGISMTDASGSSFIANWSLLTLIQGFLSAGRYNPGTYANHIEQLPRVTITSPNATTNLTNPASLSIGWTREWLRWDGQSYTTAYPAGYSEASALSYSVTYSADNGATWKYMQDDSAAIPGTRPANAALLISSASATPSYVWGTPSASFPQGTYLIRVEAYRNSLPLHYAYHEYRAFIRRS
jgi:type II secretory pathway pseudopilin PulG